MEAPSRSLWDAKGVATLLLLMFLLPLGMGLVQPEALPMPHAANGAGEEGEAPTQPWPQYMGSANKNGTMPDHAPTGGPGMDAVSNVTVLGTIDDPVINWVCLLYTSPSPRDTA